MNYFNLASASRLRPMTRDPLGRIAALIATLLALLAPVSGCDHHPDHNEVGAATVSRPPDGRVTGKLSPAHGAYLGLFYGSGSQTDTDRRIGTTPKVHLTYFNWADDWSSAPSTKHDLSTGLIPLINWEPFDIDFHDIVDGRYDSLIAARAAAAARLHGQFFLDFAAEMNEEEGWGGHDPALYKAAWRHIHDLFTTAGASNVVWVWAPNNTDSPDAPSALDYYPGSDYVDWTGMDGYNWGAPRDGFTWQSFAQVFGPLYDQLMKLGKPVIIGETASDEIGGSKAAWVTDIIPQLKSRFSNIEAVVWFDIDKERHWQIASSAASRAAFTTMATNSFWQR